MVFFTIFPLEAQTNIRGFCKTENIKAVSGYNNFLLANLNNDILPDFVLFDPQKKSYVSLFSSGYKYNLSRNNLFGNITALKEFTVKNNSKSFLSISRHNKACSEIAFEKSGNLKVLNEIKFDTFPEILKTADADNNFRNEAYICGNSFNGIVKIEKKKESLQVTQIAANRLFSDIVIADWDYDGYKDICAIDFIDNEIKLFTNDGKTNFYESRSVKTRDLPKKLIMEDINGDGFTDLLYAAYDGIGYSLGDSVSTFKKFRKIVTGFEPSDIIIKDFNNDGRKDLAVLDYQFGRLTFLFAEKSGYSNFQPDLTEYSAFAADAFNNLFLLSKSGNIRKFSRINQPSGNFQILLSESCESLAGFNIGTDLFQDYAFIDNINSELKIVVSEERRPFKSISAFKLSSSFSRLFIFEETDFNKEFYLFSPGEKLIEILRVDFLRNSSKTEQLYSLYPVWDIKAVKSNVSGKTDLHLILKDKYFTGKSVYSTRGSRFHYSQTDTIASFPSSAVFSVSDSLSIIYRFKNKGLNRIYKTTFLPQKEKKTEDLSINLNHEVFITEMKSYSKSSDFFFSQSADSVWQILDSGKSVKMLIDREMPDSMLIGDTFVKLEGRKKGLYTKSDSNYNEIINIKLIEPDKINDYFVSRFGEKYFLTFTISSSNKIIFRELK